MGHGIHLRKADGTGELELLRAGDASPKSWSPDGHWIAFTNSGSTSKRDIWLLNRSNPEDAFPLLETSFYEGSPTISPDGRWLAYCSDESGEFEIYVQSFPDGRDRRKISPGGGVEPLWSRDGKEIFFRRGDAMMVVPLESRGSELRAGALERLFEGQFAFEPTNSEANYDVSLNGERFVMVTRGGGAPPTELRIVLNWAEELKRLVPKGPRTTE